MKTVSLSAFVLAALAGIASASPIVESAQYGGSVVINYATGQYDSRVDPTLTYDSTNYATSGATGYGTGATSSTDLNAIYGDSMTMVGGSGKTLDTFKFAIFCSGSSTNPLTSAVETIRFYRQSDGTQIGAFTVNIGSLAKGYYSVYTVTALSSLNINFDTNDVVVTQKLSSVVGATRMGTVFGNNITAAAPALGSTAPGMYISNTATTAGYYTFTNYAANSNAVYQVGVIPAPGSIAVLGVAGLAARRRRR